MFITCDGCKKQVVLTTANTVLFVYDKQMWFSWIIATCCECNEEHKLFIELDAATQLITDSQCGVIHDQFAPAEVVTEYERVFQVKMPKTYELTPRLEMECNSFAVVLKNIPDDLLMDCLTEPPPKSDLPQMWVDER